MQMLRSIVGLTWIRQVSARRLKKLCQQVTAFVHGHRGSWHNPDVATDLQKLYWDQIDSYLPLSRKFFESFGPWFWTYPSKPERHLQDPIATGEAATNGSFLKHEVPLHKPRNGSL